MKFPRNAKLFRGQLDAAPFAGVFFCLVLFLILAMLINTTGVGLRLPEGSGLPGTRNPTIAVALDASNHLYFKNQEIGRATLKSELENAVRQSKVPLTLVVQADKSVSYGSLMDLTLLARSAGIRDALMAFLPRPTETPRRTGPVQ